MELIYRPRRLRCGEMMRRMVRETRVSKSALIYPVFVLEGEGREEEIPSMPGQYRRSADRLLPQVEMLLARGIDKLMLFGVPDKKDPQGSGAWEDHGVVQEAIRTLKAHFPALYLIGDVCLCEYTTHGHCGVLPEHDRRRGHSRTVDNDATLDLLARIALSQVEAGADMAAPSDMMDGRVAAIRHMLDLSGHTEVPIMSYAVKYASSFYGPFRAAAGSAPAFGDRKGYQMDWHNRREARKEALLDVDEGADILMVKPAMAYGDIISDLRAATDLPLAAYSVSGEYAMIKTCAGAGFADETDLMCEAAAAAFRAGAGIYLTYFAPELAQAIDEGRLG